MRKAIKQIGVCALLLFLICILCRVLFFRTYTVHVPIRPGSPMAQAVAEDAPRARMEEPDVARPDGIRVHPDHLSVRIRPASAGETDLQIVDARGEEIFFSVLRVTRSGTVIDLSTGGFHCFRGPHNCSSNFRINRLILNTAIRRQNSNFEKIR